MGCDRWRKREKNYRPEFRSFSTRAWKFQKKYKQKKLENLFPALFLAKTEVGQEREKKFTPELCSYPTWARKFQIKSSKKILKIKNVNSDIISIQNGLGEGRKRKKKIIPEFRSHSTRARKFWKKKI